MCNDALSITRPFLVALILLAGGCVAEEPGEHRIVPKQDVVAPTEAETEPVTPEAAGALGPAERGRQLFTGKGACFACHGPDGEGTQIAPDLTDDTWLHVTDPVTPEKIADVIVTGVANPIVHPGIMPPMGGAPLTEEEVEAIAAYVFTLSH